MTHLMITPARIDRPSRLSRRARGLAASSLMLVGAMNAAAEDTPTRIARSDASPADATRPADRAATASPTSSARQAEVVDPIDQARRMIAECQARVRATRDYTCTFFKRERLDGKLSAPHVMSMKARNSPASVYMKFQKPYAGREAIYVAGKHGNKVLAHDVGLGRLVAGTLTLEPTGAMAMEDCRHPITEAGIGPMVEMVAKHWSRELRKGETQVVIHPHAKVGDRPCTMIESTHPARIAGDMFHKVKLYIDHEHGVPIRFEAFDWPVRPGHAPELAEEYTFANLRMDVGLHDSDFETTNAAYSFGRF